MRGPREVTHLPGDPQENIRRDVFGHASKEQPPQTVAENARIIHVVQLAKRVTIGSSAHNQVSVTPI
jgi:hypothetical protein